MLELSIIGLRRRHQRAPRRIGERSAYFAHRCKFVPISRLVGSDLRLPEVSVGWKPFFWPSIPPMTLKNDAQVGIAGR
jgi:hypothetical protein